MQAWIAFATYTVDEHIYEHDYQPENFSLQCYLVNGVIYLFYLLAYFHDYYNLYSWFISYEEICAFGSFLGIFLNCFISMFSFWEIINL